MLGQLSHLHITLVLMQIESLSVTFHGHELVADSTLELNYGRYAMLCASIRM